jgi:hypothetical protein
MPVEIRRLTVKSVIQREPEEDPFRREESDLRAIREELLEECRRMMAEALRNERER